MAGLQRGELCEELLGLGEHGLHLVAGVQLQRGHGQPAHAVHRDRNPHQRGHQRRQVRLRHLQPGPRPRVRGDGPRAEVTAVGRQPRHARAPGRQGRDGLLVHAGAVRAPVRHAVVRGHQEGRAPVPAEVLLQHPDGPPDALVHGVDVVAVLLAVRLVHVPVGVAAQQVQEEDVAVLSQLELQVGVIQRGLEKVLHLQNLNLNPSNSIVKQGFTLSNTQVSRLLMLSEAKFSISLV